MNIYCVGCEQAIDARLTDGKEIYPRRAELYKLPFWKCDRCKNYVGCHHKTKDRTKPLGCIPTAELRSARKLFHELIDPIWQLGKMKRRELYGEISRAVGWDYHTAQTRSVEQVRQAYRAAAEIGRSMRDEP